MQRKNERGNNTPTKLKGPRERDTRIIQGTKTGTVLEGIMLITRKGFGFVRIEGRERGDDVRIEAGYLNTALNNDRVKIALHSKKPNEQETGEVLKVLVRAKPGFSGTLEENGVLFVSPQDPKMYADIVIPKEKLTGAKKGDKVFAVITNWTDHKKNPEGEIVEILGLPGENNAEMHAIALERGFASGFPAEVEEEALRLKQTPITEEEIALRRDIREIATFTIDPEDAKDFDDAISFKKIEGDRYEIGVHIADVSHYVRSGTALDKEAIKRGTSVYLVDRTIPMLPEILSNDLCSLNPNEDKLTFSAIFEMTSDGEVLKRWFGRTIINSDKRFSYEEAQKVLDAKEGIFYEELATLNGLAKKLLAKRFSRGAMSLDQEEVKFILDDSGVPLRVYKKVRGDTHKLIEEFMLLANREVAEFVSQRERETKRDHIFVYRIHDEPNTEKVANLAYFLKTVGYELKLEDGKINPKELNKMLVSLEGKAEKDLIQTAVVRSMAKAVYATKNIGHYGLAFDTYTHFTSPIRRYPDILSHRLIFEYLAGREIKKEMWHEYDVLCTYSSQREKEAADAERASIKYKQVEYMSSRVGQTFNGVISGVMEWGIFVQESETKCEGMVSVRTLDDDYYTFDEKHYRLVGERTKKKYTLGDRVRFKVMSADREKQTLDYALVPSV